MGALKAELAAAKRTESSGGTPGRTSEIISMQRQILEKLPGIGGGGGGGDGEVASLRHQLEQSRSDASEARSMVQQLRQQVFERNAILEPFFEFHSCACQVQQQQQQQPTARDGGSSAEAESLRRENSQLKQEIQVGATHKNGAYLLNRAAATEV